MEKEEIRKELLHKRDELSKENWNAFSKAIEKTILKSKLFKECDKLFVYSDFHSEVGTVSLIEEALILGKQVYVPKVIDNLYESRMDFFRIDSSYELVRGYMGIMEPLASTDRVFNYDNNKDQNLLMLVPGIAFDHNGNRLGYGKGYYDTYLKDKENILTIGLSFSLQVMDSLPVNSHDKQLAYVVTENTTLEEINRINF